MRAEGVVESVADDKMAVVSIKRDTACGETCAGCGANCNMRNNSLTAINLIGAETGDRVFVEMHTKTVLKSAFVVYILPLVLFFLGYFASDFFGGSEMISAVCGGVLFVISFVLLHFFDKKHSKDINARICEIIK